MEQVKAPALLLKPETELALLNASVATALERLENGHALSTPGDAATKAAAITAFLAEHAA
jgi:ribosome assembly protein YihI (activator of Der GTPase)